MSSAGFPALQLFFNVSHMYYVFWVCVCSRRYPACNAYGPYCHQWASRLYNYFSSYLICITYSQCVFLAVGIQHEMRMRRVVICGLLGYTIIFRLTSQVPRFKEIATGHKMCLFVFSGTLSETLLIKFLLECQNGFRKAVLAVLKAESTPGP